MEKAEILVQEYIYDRTTIVVRLKIGNQSFDINSDIDEELEHALWSAKMLQKALGKINVDAKITHKKLPENRPLTDDD